MAQTGGDVIHRPTKKSPGFFDVLLVGRDCDVALLHHTVGGVRNFIQPVQALIVDGDLRGGAGVQGVEQF